MKTSRELPPISEENYHKAAAEQFEESKRSPLFYTRMNYDKNVSAFRQKRILGRNSVRPDLTKSS